MIVGEHVLWGFLFSLAAGYIFPGIGPYGIILVFLASVFIDVDHYFAYVKAKKDWSLKKACEWFVIDDKTTQSFVEKSFIPLHSIEFIALIIGILYLINYMIWPVWVFKFFFCILLGCVFHIILDLGYILWTHGLLYGKISFIYSYRKNMLLLGSEHIKRYNEIINNWQNQMMVYRNQKV